MTSSFLNYMYTSLVTSGRNLDFKLVCVPPWTSQYYFNVCISIHLHDLFGRPVITVEMALLISNFQLHLSGQFEGSVPFFILLFFRESCVFVYLSFSQTVAYLGVHTYFWREVYVCSTNPSSVAVSSVEKSPRWWAKIDIALDGY